jgi:hypothetical protein
MKSWQIFLLGTIGLAAVLLLSSYERFIAGSGAVAIVAIVLAGFLAHPRREVFIVRTSNWIESPDDVSLEHDCVVVRVEVARLWLLFIPTFLAVSFLVIAATTGTVWNYPLIGSSWTISPYLFGRVLVVVVWGITSTWLSERWTLHQADAGCCAGYADIKGGRVSYSFVDRHGEYYGGEDFAFGLSSREVANIVLYSDGKPQRNKIGLACLFHRLTIIGHGLADLDEETLASHMIPGLAHQPPG